MKMTKIENTSQTSTIVSKETDNISKNSFLHQYYVNIMENTEQSSVKVILLLFHVILTEFLSCTILKDFFFRKSSQIERAVKFLLLPEISKLTDDHTKAMFLLSKGLTHDEVLEAFEQYYKKQKRKLTVSDTFRLLEMKFYHFSHLFFHCSLAFRNWFCTTLIK